MAKYADSNGLLYLIQLIKGAFAQKSEIPTATTTSPKMDGTAAVGSETKWAKGDHVHPTDTSRAPTSHASSATTYGAGTSSNYGHVKLSDATDGTAAAASGGTAATPKAVSDALAAAKTYADSNDADTKNTAGSTDSSSKLFLVGATEQAANPQTYSQDTVYAGTDGHVYSNSKQAVNLSDSQALTNKTYDGLTLTAATTGFTIAGGTTSKTLTVSGTYTLGAACAKGVDTSISAGSTSTNLPTTKAVVDYLAGVAGALVYKGTVSAESSLLNTALKVGWFYIVSMPDANTTSVSIAGQTCEAGDMVIVNTAGTYTTSSGLAAAVDVIQSNIEALTNAEIDDIWASAFAA